MLIGVVDKAKTTDDNAGSGYKKRDCWVVEAVYKTSE